MLVHHMAMCQGMVFPDGATVTKSASTFSDPSTMAMEK